MVRGFWSEMVIRSRIVNIVHTCHGRLLDPAPNWPLQDIISLRVFCARINTILCTYPFVWALHFPLHRPCYSAILFPADPLLSQYKPHNIGGGNIVQRPSANGLRLWIRPRPRPSLPVIFKRFSSYHGLKVCHLSKPG